MPPPSYRYLPFQRCRMAPLAAVCRLPAPASPAAGCPPPCATGWAARAAARSCRSGATRTGAPPGVLHGFGWVRTLTGCPERGHSLCQMTHDDSMSPSWRDHPGSDLAEASRTHISAALLPFPGAHHRTHRPTTCTPACWLRTCALAEPKASLPSVGSACRSVRVSNLSEDVTEEDLAELFGPFGPIQRIFVAKDRETGAPPRRALPPQLCAWGWRQLPATTVLLSWCADPASQPAPPVGSCRRKPRLCVHQLHPPRSEGAPQHCN